MMREQLPRMRSLDISCRTCFGLAQFVDALTASPAPVLRELYLTIEPSVIEPGFSPTEMDQEQSVRLPLNIFQQSAPVLATVGLTRLVIPIVEGTSEPIPAFAQVDSLVLNYPESNLPAAMLYAGLGSMFPNAKNVWVACQSSAYDTDEIDDPEDEDTEAKAVQQRARTFVQKLNHLTVLCSFFLGLQVYANLGISSIRSLALEPVCGTSAAIILDPLQGPLVFVITRNGDNQLTLRVGSADDHWVDLHEDIDRYGMTELDLIAGRTIISRPLLRSPEVLRRAKSIQVAGSIWPYLLPGLEMGSFPGLQRLSIGLDEMYGRAICFPTKPLAVPSLDVLQLVASPGVGASVDFGKLSDLMNLIETESRPRLELRSVALSNRVEPEMNPFREISLCST